MLPIWICSPHAGVMTQRLKLENDREVVDDVGAEDSREVKSVEAEMMS